MQTVDRFYFWSKLLIGALCVLLGSIFQDQGVIMAGLFCWFVFIVACVVYRGEMLTSSN